MRKALIAVFALALVFAFTMPAAAQSEWNWYGSARMDTFSNKYKGDTFGGAPDHSWRTTSWTMDGGTRLGARVRSGAISGNVEWRFRATNDNPWTEVGLRHMWGAWHYSDNGRILIGQTWTPTSIFGVMGAQLIPMSGAGYWAAGWRVPQITMTHSFGATTLTFGLVRPLQTTDGSSLKTYMDAVATRAFFSDIRPEVGSDEFIIMNEFRALPTFGGAVGGTARNTSTLPKVAAMLAHNFGPVDARVFGEWVRTSMGRFEYDGAERKESITGWQLGMYAGFSEGPFYARGAYHFGRNPGALEDTALLSPYWRCAGHEGQGGLEDVKNQGWILVAGFRVNPMFAIEAGYGQEKQKLSSSGYSHTFDEFIPFSIREKQTRFYVSAPITVAKGFTLYPEVIHNKRKGDFSSEDQGFSANRGSFTVYGVYWMINF